MFLGWKKLHKKMLAIRKKEQKDLMEIFRVRLRFSCKSIGFCCWKTKETNFLQWKYHPQGPGGAQATTHIASCDTILDGGGGNELVSGWNNNTAVQVVVLLIQIRSIIRKHPTGRHVLAQNCLLCDFHYLGSKIVCNKSPSHSIPAVWSNQTVEKVLHACSVYMYLTIVDIRSRYI